MPPNRTAPRDRQVPANSSHLATPADAEIVASSIVGLAVLVEQAGPIRPNTQRLTQINAYFEHRHKVGWAQCARRANLEQGDELNGRSRPHSVGSYRTDCRNRRSKRSTHRAAQVRVALSALPRMNDCRKGCVRCRPPGASAFAIGLPWSIASRKPA